jgi:hypothetical protein
VDNKTTRITLIVIVACSFIIPLAAFAMGNRQLGSILLLAGLFTAYRCFGVWMRLGRERDPERDRLASARQNQARTVMVPLLDESGVALDEASAARALQQARLRAGPRDTVIGVQRRPSEVTPQ